MITSALMKWEFARKLEFLVGIVAKYLACSPDPVAHWSHMLFAIVEADQCFGKLFDSKWSNSKLYDIAGRA